MKSNKVFLPLVVVLLNIAMFWFGVVSANTVDKIVAIINSDVVTQSEINKGMVLLQQMGTQEQLDNATLRQRVLDSFIDNSLQLQQAKAYGITVNDNELAQIIANIAKTHGITVEQLKTEVPIKEHMSFDAFKNKLREQILIARLQQYVIGKEINVSEAEVDALLRQQESANKVMHYHVLDVVITVLENTTGKLERKVKQAAWQVMRKLKKNMDVAQAIREVEGGFPELVIQSNDLDWRSAKELPDLFVKKIVAMRAGQIIGPIVAPNGVHILKLLESGDKPLDANTDGVQQPELKLTRAQATEMAFRRKLSAKIKPWLQEQRKKAYIKIIK